MSSMSALIPRRPRQHREGSLRSHRGGQIPLLAGQESNNRNGGKVQRKCGSAAEDRARESHAMTATGLILRCFNANAEGNRNIIRLIVLYWVDTKAKIELSAVVTILKTT